MSGEPAAAQPASLAHRATSAAGSVLRSARRWAGRSAGTGRGRVLLALIAVVALALPSGLGFLLVSVFGGAGGGGDAERVATIGVMAPLSGASADAGVSVRNAVTLAVEEANRQGAIPGWKLEVVAHDDLSRPDGGAAGADLFADDQRMIGVVGPLSSSVAMVSLGRLSEAGLPVISPSNAEPTLTMQPDRPDERPYPTYFRLSGTDEQLARTTAGYAVHTLGRSRISVVDGGPDYGTITLAERFARNARDAGATVATVHRVDGGSTDDDQIRRTALRIRDEAPDLVYLATGAAFAGELRRELADDGVPVQVLGSDQLLDHGYVERAKSLADGDLIADLSVPLSELPAAGAFVAAYAKRFGEPAGVTDLLTGSTPEDSGSPRDSRTPDGSTPDGSTADGSTADGSTADGSTADGPGTAGTGAPGAGETPSDPRDLSDPPAPDERSAAAAEVRTGGDATAPGQDTDEAREREIERSQAAELARLRAEAVPPVAAGAYDAARALIRAAVDVLPGRTAVTAAVRAAVAHGVELGVFAGITGEVAFDERGDLRGPRMALYAVLGERFVPLRVDSVR